MAPAIAARELSVTHRSLVSPRPVWLRVGFVLCLFLSLVAGQCKAITPGKPIANYEQRVWTKLDGLSDNNISNVLQSHNGYLWILTRRSLTRFDGLQFSNFSRQQVFGTPQVPSLNRNITSSLYEDREGRIWVAIGDRVAYFENGRFKPLTPLPSSSGTEPAFIIHTILEDHEGTMWFGTETGLLRYRQGQITTFAGEHGLTNPAMALAEDLHHRLWVGTNGGGLYLFQNGEFVPVRGKFSNDYITALLADGETLWIGTVSDGLRCLRNGEFIGCLRNEGLSKESIRVLYKDRERNVWVGTQYEGLRVITPTGQVLPFRKADGFVSNRVTDLSEDIEGNVWFGTANGLVRFRDRTFLTVGPELSSEFLPARTVIEDHRGDIWIGTHVEGLYRLHEGKVSAVSGISSNSIRALYVDNDGSLWIGTDPGGLDHLLPNGQITVITTRQGLAGNVVKSILRDRDGSLWIGTDHGGLSRFRDGRFTNFTVRDGLGSNTVLGIMQGRDGTLWFATDAGLSRFQNGKFINLTAKDGLLEDRIRSIYEDSDGVLWIGTRNSGLNRLKDGKVTHYSNDPNLAGYGVFSILEDDRSYLWMSTLRGLVRVSKQELNDFAAGKTNTTGSLDYGVADGVASEECSSAVQPAGWKGHDGRLWFPTTSGVVVVNPSDVQPDPPPPPVTIGELLFDRNSIPLNASTIDLPPGHGDLEFRFSALAFTAPESVRFKYKLEGYDKDWTDAGVQRLAEYTNLPPGTYRFRVLARRSRGPWSEQATEIALQLRPHFYQTYRFYLVCALAAILLLWLILRIQRRRLKRREAELALMKDAMKRRMEAEEQLRQSEARYRDLFESAVYGIYRSRPRSYIEVNRAMVAMLGYDSEEEVVALDPATQVYANPEDFARLNQVMESAGRVEAMEVTWKRKDGKRIIVLLSGRLIPGSESKADTAEVIVEDITERKHLEEQLRQSQKMEAIGRLAGGIAHDFNNLLTIILGYTRLLLDGDVGDQDRDSALRQVETAAERASDLTNQLLAFSRHQIIQSSVHSLNAIVTNMESMLERVIGEDIELSTDLAPDLGLIKGDRSQIEQVIMNLAVNARDAMPGGGKLRFKTRNVKETGKTKSSPGSGTVGANYLLLEVTDTGMGMDTETLERIFDPFFTTKEKGRGTGLGLSTVYGIIEQAGGRIRADSKVGKGTTFYIYLPQVLESETLGTGRQAPVPEIHGTETILLIEDHTALRELTNTMLKANGYNVLQAEGARQAQRICREYKGPIDLIVTDVVMPEMSGPELAKVLQKLRPGVRLLYTSGYTEDHRLRQEVLENKLPFLQKPFTRANLLSKVREVLSTPISQTVT